MLRIIAAIVCALNGPASLPAEPPGAVPPESAPVAPPATHRSSSEFVPSIHGFGFRNVFTGSPLPESLRGIGIEELVKAPTRYGKCGGMSAAAADFFLCRMDVPTTTKPPADGTPLFAYISKRQIDSLGTLAVMTGKFMEYMRLPDRSASGPSAASLTAATIAPLLTRLEAGELVPLGLVYVAAAAAPQGAPKPDAPATPQPSTVANPRIGKLWENHQVLAFASPGQQDQWNREHTARIRIYDPNFPGNDDVVISVTLAPSQPGQPQEALCEQLVGTGRTIPVRGVFTMPYEHHTPPADTAAAAPPPSLREPQKR